MSWIRVTYLESWETTQDFQLRVLSGSVRFRIVKTEEVKLEVDFVDTVDQEQKGLAWFGGKINNTCSQFRTKRFTLLQRTEVEIEQIWIFSVLFVIVIKLKQVATFSMFPHFRLLKTYF